MNHGSKNLPLEGFKGVPRDEASCMLLLRNRKTLWVWVVSRGASSIHKMTPSADDEALTGERGV